MKAIPAKETRKLLFTPIIENNPIALQILGICSALAVTVKMDVTLIMCIALTSFITLSNFFKHPSPIPSPPPVIRIVFI